MRATGRYTNTLKADRRPDKGEEFVIDRWPNSRLISVSLSTSVQYGRLSSATAASIGPLRALKARCGTRPLSLMKYRVQPISTRSPPTRRPQRTFPRHQPVRRQPGADAGHFRTTRRRSSAPALGPESPGAIVRQRHLRLPDDESRTRRSAPSTPRRCRLS
jgi:hypothetical protein